MIVRALEEATNSGQKIVSPEGSWDSVRILLKDDQMRYQNHLELVYCMPGRREMQAPTNGKTYTIEPGSLYSNSRQTRFAGF